MTYPKTTTNRTTAVLLLVAALVLAGCGSTASVSERAAVSTDDGLVVTEDGQIVNAEGEVVGSADGSVIAGDGSVISGGGSDGGTVSGSTGSSGGTVSGSGSTATAPGASAPGVTAREIKVGLTYDKSAGYTNAALGYSGIGQVDQRRAYEALIAYVNKNGGVNGRKLVPVYHEFDSAGPDATTPPEVLEQRVCTTFTENRVFVAMLIGGETLTRCMNENRIIRVSSGEVDEQLLKESPLLVVLGVTLDRIARASVDRMHARGFYNEGKDGTPGYKLGLVRFDDPEFDRAAAVFKAQLAAKGLTLSDEVAIREAETVDQVQDETNSARAAVLRFKSNGITHVQFLGRDHARLGLFFMQNAEKQLYRPRYGLVSLDGGQALATLLGSDAEPQLSGSLETGWFPIFDVHRSQYSGDKTTKAFQTCIKILEDAGETFTEGDPTRNKEAIAAIFCDNFFYFAAAATAAGTTLTPETFMQGVRTIEGMDSAQSYWLSTKRTRDAIGGVKDARWFSECSCFRYTSNTIYPM